MWNFSFKSEGNILANCDSSWDSSVPSVLLDERKHFDSFSYQVAFCKKSLQPFSVESDSISHFVIINS